MSNAAATTDTPVFTPPQESPSSVASYTPSDAALNWTEFERLYPYGYRYVREVGPDGVERLGQQPLTRDDVLHPQEGDVHLNNSSHQVFCIYLYQVFKAQLEADPTAVVFQDTGVDWGVPGLKHHSPDVSVIIGVREQRHWPIFKVAEEGVKPVLVMEVTSPTSRSIDLDDKVKQYAIGGAPLYVVVDTGIGGFEAVRLWGYELTPDGYVEMEPDERGWLWLEPVSLWIGIREARVECYSRDGVRLGSYAEVSAALAREAKARAEAEERVVGAEERAAADAKARAEAEDRANAAEARLRQMEEEMRRLRGAL